VGKEGEAGGHELEKSSVSHHGVGSGPGPGPVGDGESVYVQKIFGLLASNAFKHVLSLSVGSFNSFVFFADFVSHPLRHKITSCSLHCKISLCS
jgi:hypothetical protein